MITQILTARIDDVHGEAGYCLDCLPQFEDMPSTAGEGMIIAHDLLEHQNGPENIGTHEDEIQALGAAWYIRGQHGSLRKDQSSYHTPAEGLASDIGRMCRDYCGQGSAELPVIAYKGEHLESETWAEIVAYAHQQTDMDDEEMADYGHRIDEFLDRVPALLALGYDKASVRFPNAWDAYTLFWNIADALEPFIKDNEPYEGQQVELRYDEETLQAYADEYYPEYEEELSCDDCAIYFIADGEEDVNPQGYTRCGDCVQKEEAA